LFEYRPLTPHDQWFVWEMLYEAIYALPGAARPPRSILDLPEISRYAEGWGRPGDFGFAAVQGDTPAGAAWLRLFAVESPGYGFVAAEIPELSIAVLPGWRGQGIGTQLLKRLAAWRVADGSPPYPAVSLSVAAANPAVRLYTRAGFKILREEGDSLVMVCRQFFDHDHS
jgi:GNAT superfamily N-acetyltransferase